MNLGFTIGGYAAALVLGGLWLNARDNLATEIEACNTRTAQSIAGREKIAREAEREAAGRAITEAMKMAENERKAREIATSTAQEAKSSISALEVALEEAKRVEMPKADPVACLNAPVPADILDRVRN